MTDEQINRVIAEACGWTDIDGLSAKGLMGTPPESLCSFNYIPDYCNDLNAMHQAEKCLSEKHMREYIFELHNITDGDMNAQGDFWDRAKLYYPVVCATARQRAEAILRALKLWEEEE